MEKRKFSKNKAILHNSFLNRAEDIDEIHNFLENTIYQNCP